MASMTLTFPSDVNGKLFMDEFIFAGFEGSVAEVPGGKIAVREYPESDRDDIEQLARSYGGYLTWK